MVQLVGIIDLNKKFSMFFCFFSLFCFFFLFCIGIIYGIKTYCSQWLVKKIHVLSFSTSFTVIITLYRHVIRYISTRQCETITTCKNDNLTKCSQLISTHNLTNIHNKTVKKNQSDNQLAIPTHIPRNWQRLYLAV